MIAKILKLIAPKGYISGTFVEYRDGKKLYHGYCQSDRNYFGTLGECAPLPSKERAELRAIMAARAFERGQK